jgi:hypothetical protein
MIDAWLKFVPSVNFVLLLVIALTLAWYKKEPHGAKRIALEATLAALDASTLRLMNAIEGMRQQDSVVGTALQSEIRFVREQVVWLRSRWEKFQRADER